MSEQHRDSVITVENLTCQYGKKTALYNVSLDVQRGRVFGLVGENGAGKTTLMKHLLGALTPTVGKVRVLGHDPTANHPAVLSRVGYLSEDRDLPRWMRVKELMRYSRAFYPDWDESYAQQLREEYDLDPNSRIKSLSRGELARVGLLIALAHRPEILLLDEPSSGLDAVARRDILAVVVRAVAEEGRTVVFSSHLLDEVERVADDVAMIHDGRLNLHMPMDELKSMHQRMVVEFSEAQSEFPELACVLDTEGEGKHWAAICYGEPAANRAALESAGARIVEESAPTLDTVFIAQVTGQRKSKAAV